MIFGRWFAQPVLTAVGLLMLALVPIGLTWARLDHRLVRGELVALKPTKFAASIGVYLLTVSWMLGFARPERLGAPLVQAGIWGLAVGAAVEFFCIALQAARGRASHFNTATPFDAGIAGTMLIMAILFVGCLLPLAWEVARRPRPDAPLLMVIAVIAGLVATFVLGALTGTGMARAALGPVPRHDLVLPLIGWRVTGGTGRIAHFLGVHALQAFPLMATATQMLNGRAAPWLFTCTALGYVAATMALLC